jgi:hypothetical protein
MGYTDDEDLDGLPRDRVLLRMSPCLGQGLSPSS